MGLIQPHHPARRKERLMPADIARLDDVRARLTQPTPAPLEGQQIIDLSPRYEQPTLDQDDQP